MAKINKAETGRLGVIQEQEDGKIFQIGLTQNQSDLLQSFLAVLSKESPLVKMGAEYELQLKKQS